MIYNYGLLWHRDRIFWGNGPKPAHLRGMENRSRREVPPSNTRTVDFREQIGIYALYQDFELVYVGQTGANAKKGEEGTNFYTRLNNHKADDLADRWNRFSWFGIRKVNKTVKKTAGYLEAGHLAIITTRTVTERADVLNTLEAMIISISEPKLNRQGGSWKPAEEYFQWWDDKEREEQKGIAK